MKKTIIAHEVKTVLAAIVVMLGFCLSLTTPAVACNSADADAEPATEAPRMDDSVPTMNDADDKDDASIPSMRHFFVRYIAADTKRDLLDIDEFFCQEGECFDITPVPIFGYRALPSTISAVAGKDDVTFIVWFLPVSHFEEPALTPVSESENDVDGPCAPFA